MQFRCKQCNKSFWGYVQCSYKKTYFEDVTIIEIYTKYGKFAQENIVRFTDDGLPMIEYNYITNERTCKFHTKNPVLSSYG